MSSSAFFHTTTTTHPRSIPPSFPNPRFPSSNALQLHTFNPSTIRYPALRIRVIPDGSVLVPAPILTDPPLSDHWKTWAVGFVIAALLPLLKSKWGPLLKLLDEAEEAIETADRAAEATERVAEGVEELAEKVADHSPAGSKIHAAATTVEKVAEEAARKAHVLDSLLDKVEEIEKKVESLVDHPTVDNEGDHTGTTKQSDS